LHSAYEELLQVMSITDVCELVCEIFNSIPIKDTAAHPLSPANLCNSPSGKEFFVPTFILQSKTATRHL
jgi:hypothetical protein